MSTSPRSTDPSMLAGLYAFLNAKPRGTRVTLIVAAVAVSVAAVAAAAVLGLTDQAAYVGSPAGLVLFTAVLAWRETLASDRLYAKTDLKSRMPLSRRRFWVGVAAAVFAIIVLLAGSHVPVVVAGTVVVFVVAALVAVFRATPAEAAHARDNARNAQDL